jgi:hypothetical protein
MHAKPGAGLTRVIDRCGDLRGYLYFLGLGDDFIPLEALALLQGEPASVHQSGSGR